MTTTVFIVDDDPDIRLALAELLQSEGLYAESYADGGAFLAACDAWRTGCVLLDLAMPGMSGHEVQAALHANGVRMPVIFLTGHGDVPLAVRSMQAGAVDFLEKPVQPSLLLNSMYRALAEDALRQPARQQRRELQNRLARLSERERQVLALLVAGFANKEIASKLGLSHRTIETHRRHVMQTMAAGNVAELVTMAAPADTTLDCRAEIIRPATQRVE